MMALKVDMAKAYDRMEWPFIKVVLLATGFPTRLTRIIMSCISSVSYQILINGQPSRSFNPERGLRQGDPLSPYIFILCANVLSGLMHKENQNKKIHGIRVARSAPKITHLLFADDSLLFARANVHEAETITRVLNSYQLASGQLVSSDKSEVSYSRNVPENETQMIYEKIDVKTVASHTRYLGLPVFLGDLKRISFLLSKNVCGKSLKAGKKNA